MTTDAGSDLVVTALGVSIRISVAAEQLRDTLRVLVSDLAAAPDPAAPARTIEVGGSGPWSVRSDAFSVDVDSSAEAVGGACAALNLSAVAATPLLTLHCAVLSRGSRTLAVPGKSGLGKSTLTAGLLQRGWKYVSDEALAYDRLTDRLVPYPRPLGLSAWSARTLGITTGIPASAGERLLRAVDLGTSVDQDPGPVTDVLVLEPDRSTRPSLHSSEPHRADVLAELFRRGFTHHVDVGYALERLGSVVQDATMHRLTVGEPVATALLVDQTLPRDPAAG